MRSGQTDLPFPLFLPPMKEAKARQLPSLVYTGKVGVNVETFLSLTYSGRYGVRAGTVPSMSYAGKARACSFGGFRI